VEPINNIVKSEEIAEALGCFHDGHVQFLGSRSQQLYLEVNGCFDPYDSPDNRKSCCLVFIDYREDSLRLEIEQDYFNNIHQYPLFCGPRRPLQVGDFLGYEPVYEDHLIVVKNPAKIFALNVEILYTSYSEATISIECMLHIHGINGIYACPGAYLRLIATSLVVVDEKGRTYCKEELTSMCRDWWAKWHELQVKQRSCLAPAQGERPRASEVPSQDLLKKADSGDPEALFAVANLYFSSIRSAEDFEHALQWYARAAAAGHAEAQYRIGEILVSRNRSKIEDYSDQVRARQYFGRAARQGHLDAIFQLGVLYVTGRGGNKNIKKAVTCFRKAAKDGGQAALYNLGAIYQSRDDIRCPHDVAFRYFLRSAQQGYAAAQYAVGTAYLYGRGVEKDIDKSIIWLRRAGAQAEGRALLTLGHLFRQGLGVARNLEAAYYFHRCAMQHFAFRRDRAFHYHQAERLVVDLVSEIPIPTLIAAHVVFKQQPSLPCVLEALLGPVKGELS